MSVQYDLDSDASGLEDGMERAVRAMAAAEKQADATTSATKKLDAAADALGKKSSVNAGKLGDLAGGLDALGEGFGTGAQAAADLLDASEAVVEILGPLGAGLAATVAVGAALTVGLHALAGAAVEAKGRLKEAGKEAQLPKDAVESLEDYEFATKKLQEALDKLLVVVGGELADDLALAVKHLADLVEWGAKSTKTVKDIADAYLDFVSLGFADELQRLSKEHKRLAEAQLETKQSTETWQDKELALYDALKKKGELLKENAGVTAQIEEQEKKATEAAKKRHDEMIEAVLAQKEAEADALTEQREKQEEYLSWLEDARKASYEAQAEELHKFTDALIERNEEQIEALEEQQEQEAEFLEAKKEAHAQAAQDILLAWSDMFAALADLNLQAKEDALDATRDRLKEARAAVQEEIELQREYTEGLSQEQAERYKRSREDELEELQAHRDHLKQRAEAQKEEAREAFRLSQAAAISSVLAQGAVALIGMIANLAPFSGPFAPLIAGGIVGPSVAASLAQIGKNKPPAHDGGMFGADEFVAPGGRTLRDNEKVVVFNQRASESGAPERAMAENRNPGGSTPSQLVIADFGRVVAEATVRDARRPGSPFARAFGSAKRGVVDPYRRH